MFCMIFSLVLFIAGVSVYAMEYDTDWPGMDYKNFNLQSDQPTACETECVKDSNCKVWTYVKPGVQEYRARCWLKNGMPETVTNECCTSGISAQPSGRKRTTPNNSKAPQKMQRTSSPIPYPATDKGVMQDIIHALPEQTRLVRGHGRIKSYMGNSNRILAIEIVYI